MINMAKSDGVARILAMAAIGSGSGANVDYSNVKNKPQINGNELEGNKSAADLGLATNGVISNVSYEASTGVLTFEKEDGTSFTIDLPLELLIESGEYNPDTQQIVLTLANKDVITIDVKDLISTYHGDDETIELFVEDEKQKFRIKQTIMDKIVDPIMFLRNDSSDALKEKAQKAYDYYKKNNKPYPNMYYCRQDISVDSYIYNFMGMDKNGDTSYKLRFARPQDYSNISDWWAWNTENIYFTVVNDVVNRANLSENGFNISRSYSRYSPGSLSSRNTEPYTPTSDYNPSTKLYTDQRVQSIAPDYNATSTYKVGDYVSYQGKFYKCTTAIETAEAWNSEHWSETTVKDEFNGAIFINYANENVRLAQATAFVKAYKSGKRPFLMVQSNVNYIATDIRDWGGFFRIKLYYQETLAEKSGYGYNISSGVSWQLTISYDKTTLEATQISEYGDRYRTEMLSHSLKESPKKTYPLGVANTTEYTPTGEYNPATKKYVDDAVAGISSTPFYELEVVFDNGYKLTDASKTKVDSIFAHIKNKEAFNAILYGNDVSDNRVMFPWSGNSGANAIYFEALDNATVGSHYFYDRYIIKPDYSVVIDQNIIPASIPGSLYLRIYDIDTDEEIIKKLKEAYKTISSNGNLVVMGSYSEDVQTETDFIRNEYRLTNYNFKEKEMMWETLGKAELEFALYGEAIGGNIKTHIIRITYTNTNDVEKVEKENLDTYLPLTEIGAGATQYVINSTASEENILSTMKKVYAEYKKGIMSLLNYVDANNNLFSLFEIRKYDGHVEFYVRNGAAGATNYGVGYYAYDRYKINCTITNDDISAVSIQELADTYTLVDNAQILGINNTTEFTPTQDYQPATKKYVDDNAKTYTAGENITISEDNVISANISGEIDGKADKATTISGYGITDAYTKTEVDAKVSSVYKYKGSVADENALPTEGQVTGDVYNLEDTGMNVAWDGSKWDKLGNVVDLTPYLTKEDAGKTYAAKATTLEGYGITDAYTATAANTELDKKVDKEAGKQLSTNDYTTEDKNKLTGVATGAEVNKIDAVKVNGTALEITDKAVNIDLSNYATKSTTLAGYGITNAYTKDEVNTELGKKANSSDVYTKTEVNDALANKLSNTDVIDGGTF